MNITLTTVLLFLAGIAYGSIIGVIGQKMMTSKVMQLIPRNDKEVQKMKRQITVRWWLRFLLDAVALFVLYKLPPMLLGAGLGIVLVSKFFIVLTIKKSNHSSGQ